MKNKKRTMAITLTAAMIAGLVCTPCVTLASEGKQTIYISTRNGTGSAAAWGAVAEGYEALHPDVDVVVDLKASDGYDTWVTNAVSSADTTNADIVNIDVAGNAAGKTINFLDYADDDSPYSDGVWTDQMNFDVQIIDYVEGEETWQKINFQSVQVCWLYNKDIFEEVGVEVPATWDEFVSVCGKIYDAGYQPVAVDGNNDAFYGGCFAWLERVYVDQVVRSNINITRSQPGDYTYDPEIDDAWEYDPTDPYNDDPNSVTQNPVRWAKAVKEGEINLDNEGYKEVWTNLAEVFPKYAGGDALFGMDSQGAKNLFYQNKAAIFLGAGWDIVGFARDMKALEKEGKVTDSEGNVIDGIKSFELGTFNMPSMEGENIQAKARTLEVANGMLGAIKKGQEHNDLVADFMMYFTSTEGMSKYLAAGIAEGMTPSGPSLIYDVEYPQDIAEAFEGTSFIGNCDKVYMSTLSNGIQYDAAAVQQHYKNNYDFLKGNITVDEFAKLQQEQVMDGLPHLMENMAIGEGDLANPANEPTGE